MTWMPDRTMSPWTFEVCLRYPRVIGKGFLQRIINYTCRKTLDVVHDVLEKESESHEKIRRMYSSLAMHPRLQARWDLHPALPRPRLRATPRNPLRRDRGAAYPWCLRICRCWCTRSSDQDDEQRLARL